MFERLEERTEWHVSERRGKSGWEGDVRKRKEMRKREGEHKFSNQGITWWRKLVTQV